MAHHHDHAQDHGDAAEDRLRRLKWAAVVNAFIVVAEVVGGVLTGSLALLADAAHNLTDVGGLVVAYFAARFATLPPTEEHSFGFVRLEILSALANGVLIVLASLFIFREAFHRFLAPPDIPGVPMLAVALLGLGGNVLGAWLLRSRRHEANVGAAYTHLLADAASSVGVIVAAVVMIFTDLVILDVVVSVLIGIAVVVSGWDIVRENVRVLLQSVPREVELGALRGEVEAMDAVVECHDLHAWTLTSGQHVASLHVVVSEDRLGESDDIIREVCERFSSHGIDHTTVQVETPGFVEPGEVH